MSEQIPGYDYGSDRLARSPVTLSELDQLKSAVLFTESDLGYLRQAGEILEGQIDALLDVWYGFVGSQAHLVEYFADRRGQPNAEYLKAVRGRFGQWVRDTCRAEYDQRWLDYQNEIALRHTPAKKNQTDNVEARTAHIPLRYMIAFIYPIVATVRPFLATRGHLPGDLDHMHQAWFKAVTLQVGLWSQPYARDGMF